MGVREAAISLYSTPFQPAMKHAILALYALALLLVSTEAHMWLRYPESRGGINNHGSTTGPCSSLKEGTGNRTTFETGQNVTFQFRVNQHGPGPFKFALSKGGDNFTIVLASNIPNHVTAGPVGFNGVYVPVVLPSTPCLGCSIQLSGMAKADGTNTWYNCAGVDIVKKGSFAGIPTLQLVTPSSGQTSGGYSVIVKGTDFGPRTNKTVCKFDDIQVAGVWHSNTSVSCPVPPRNAPSAANLEVSINGGTSYSISGLVFTYTGAAITPTISHITPSSAVSGATLTITGKYFYSSSVQCKFVSGNSNYYVTGTMISSTELTCVVPTGVQGQTSIEVNIDNSDFSASNSTVTVKEAAATGPFEAVSAASASTYSPLGCVLVTLIACLFQVFVHT